MVQHALPSHRALPRPGFGAEALRALLAVLLVTFAFLTAALAPAQAQTVLPEQQALQEKLSGFRAVVDGVEGALGREGLRSVDLDDLRNRLDPVRTELAAGVSVLEPLLAELTRRVQEIGPKPEAGAAPEDPAVASERETLMARASELDAVLKQARLLKVRADQLSDRIISRRRAMFTDQLFARSYSVLDPALWISAAAAIPQELRGIGYLLRDWRAYADARVPLYGQALLLLGAILIISGVFVLRRIFSRPLRRLDLGASGEHLPRLKACLLSALLAIVRISAAPAATAAVIALLNAFDVMPDRVQEIAQGLVIGVIVVAVGNGLLTGALAPSEPRRRVLPISDEMARLIYSNATIGLWIMGAAAFLNTLHRALVVPVPLTVATAATMSIALTLVAMRTMRGLVEGSDDEADDVPARPGEETPEGGLTSTGTLQWVRLPFWVLNAVIIGSLIAGYVSFGAFLASRALIAVVMAGTAYLLIALINAVFVDGIASGPRARHVAKALGVRPASVELLSVLVAGVLKVVALVVIGVVIIGTFGTSTADIQDLLSRATFGFSIGSSTITLGDVLSALLFLAVGIVIARAVQRWFSVAILPKTSFDPGLQNSIATIIGYVGSIAVIAVAMGRIGLNLENVALVAGALSVGIGFGLQSIVSNFVSGLILLAERPIRVGDTIAVKGEEGYVRRISVRATEIETFDRASVLIPNSDLITGLVKNFTHANTTGRVIVGVNVAYDADADEIRDLLVGCACDHPQVLRSPPPRVFLMKFADSYLQFELRCVVANVDYALTVKSDLHFAILERLKAAKIGIPYTPWSIYRGGTLGPPDAADAD